MLGEEDNQNGDLPSYITGADIVLQETPLRGQSEE